jgi:hypothetical protein
MTTNDVTNHPGGSNGHADTPDRARAADLIVIDHAGAPARSSKQAGHCGRSMRNDP